jgi:hypothetical protein
LTAIKDVYHPKERLRAGEMVDKSRVSDMTVDELWKALHDKIQMLIREELRTALHEPERGERNKRPLLNLPVIDLGPWPEHLTLRREELYGDDER